jgi:hypothetical protein
MEAVYSSEKETGTFLPDHTAPHHILEIWFIQELNFSASCELFSILLQNSKDSS